MNDNEDYYRNRESKKLPDGHWVPGRNAVTGFTIKGMIMFLGLVAIVAFIKHYFF